MDEFKDPRLYRKELKEKIRRRLDEGQSRKEILDDLSPTTDQPFQKLLKRDATYVLSSKQEAAIEKINKVLLGAFTLMILASIFSNFLYYSQNRMTVISLLLAGFYLLICYFISRSILLKEGHIYRIVVQIGVLLMLATGLSMRASTNFEFDIVYIVISLGITIVGYIIHKRLFPGYKIIGDNSPKSHDDLLD